MTDQLALLVSAAIRGLSHLSASAPSGLVDLERRLRAASGGPGAGATGPIAAALETACTALAGDDLDGAYLALLTARGLMSQEAAPS